jgi:hypothetical protein
MNGFRVVAAVVCIIFLCSLIYVGSEDGNGYALAASSTLTVSISPAAAAFGVGQSQLLTAVPSGVQVLTSVISGM